MEFLLSFLLMTFVKRPSVFLFTFTILIVIIHWETVIDPSYYCSLFDFLLCSIDVAVVECYCELCNSKLTITSR